MDLQLNKKESMEAVDDEESSCRRRRRNSASSRDDSLNEPETDDTTEIDSQDKSKRIKLPSEFAKAEGLCRELERIHDERLKTAKDNIERQEKKKT